MHPGSSLPSPLGADMAVFDVGGSTHARMCVCLFVGNRGSDSPKAQALKDLHSGNLSIGSGNLATRIHTRHIVTCAGLS